MEVFSKFFTSSRTVQELNAREDMLLMLEGSVIDFNALQPSKAKFSNAVTPVKYFSSSKLVMSAFDLNHVDMVVTFAASLYVIPIPSPTPLLISTASTLESSKGM